MNYKEYFKGKKVGVVGMGAHGEMVADIKFLLRLGVNTTLYEMRSETRLHGPLAVLKEAGLAEYHMGKIQTDDLIGFDLIILSPDISNKSFFLKKAKEKEIDIEYPDTLFLKLAPSITLIGIMGACGKSTVAHMLYGMLKRSFSEYEDQGLYFIDPDLPNGSIAHLKKIKAGDVVLARIPEELINEYHTAHISPHVAIITSLSSINTHEVKKISSLLEFQTYNNFIIASDEVIDSIKEQVKFTPKAKMLRTKGKNSTLATQAAELFKVNSEICQTVVDEFTGLKGHQELVKKMNGIEYYNDASSISPMSTLYALRDLSNNKNVVLILGGAYTGYDYGDLIKNIPEYAHTVILLPGSGTIGFRKEIEKLQGIKYMQSPNLEEAVLVSKDYARKGDIVLFSPGCEAIGVHISRRERGEKFVKAVRSL